MYTFVKSYFNKKRKKNLVIQFADLALVYGLSMSSPQLLGSSAHRADDFE